VHLQYFGIRNDVAFLKVLLLILVLIIVVIERIWVAFGQFHGFEDQFFGCVIGLFWIIF
jgi:hypothetical protein